MTGSLAAWGNPFYAAHSISNDNTLNDAKIGYFSVDIASIYSCFTTNSI
jgi:hypothetical protein